MHPAHTQSLIRLCSLCVVSMLLTGLLASAKPELVYSIGIGDGATDSDGATFTVELREEDTPSVLLARDHWDQNIWKECRIDLSKFAEKNIVLRFCTDPGPAGNTTYDWACWGKLQITDGETILADLSELKIWQTGIILPDGTAAPMSSNQTGATFRHGKRKCGEVALDGFLAHPPYRGDAAGGTTFAEYRVHIGPNTEDSVERPPMPAVSVPESPFNLDTAPCFRLKQRISVDGDLGDWPETHKQAPLWIDRKAQMSVEVVSHKPGYKAGWTGPHDLSTSFFIGWDDDALYLAEIRRDDKLVMQDTMSEDFMGSDALRICISTGKRGDTLTASDFVIAILPEGEKNQTMVRRCTYGEEVGAPVVLRDVEVAAVCYSGGWVLEVAIPFRSLGITPEPGLAMGFQLIATDSDTPMDRHYEMLWHPKDRANYWRTPAAFGEIRLCESSFAWLEMPRRIYAVGEMVRPRVGLHSVDGLGQGSQSLLLRTASGSSAGTIPESAAVHGTTLDGLVLNSSGRYTLEYNYKAGLDTLQHALPIEVVRDVDISDLTSYTQPDTLSSIPSSGAKAGPEQPEVKQVKGQFVFQAAGGRVSYRVRPSPGWDIETRVDGSTVYTSDPQKTGPVLASGATISATGWTVSKVRLENNRLHYTVQDKDNAEVTMTIGIEEGTLVADVAGPAQFSRFNGPLEGTGAQNIFIPYLEPRLGVFHLGGAFVSAFCDWTTTGSTVLRRYGSTEYKAKTNGSRNALRERLFFTVAPTLFAALPNLPNPKSPFHDVLSRKLVLDVWGFGKRYSDTAAYLRMLHTYGVEDIAIIYHVWQKHGYDNGLPEHAPANAKRGGHNDMRILGRTAKELGYLLSLHENYIDYYPNYPAYTEDAIALNSSGHKIEAWYMPSTGIQSYRMKPTWIEKYVREESPRIHDWYATTAAYLDVHSVNFPFQIDHDADEDGAASLSYAFEKLTWLFQYMRDTHKGPLFGEGNMHSVWAGRIDGCEAQIGGRAGEIRPVLVDYDLLKIHPLTVNHGMGYYSRWQRMRRGLLTDEEMDKYRSQELAYGHAAFINTSMMSNLTQVLREYFLIQPLQSRYCPSAPVHIGYLFDPLGPGKDHWVSAQIASQTEAPRKVRIEYANGLKLWINDGRDNWEAEGKRLPPHGFVAKGPDILSYTARLNEGFVGDYSETGTEVFVDPRTWQAPYVAEMKNVNITPLKPVLESAGTTLRMTYRWEVGTPTEGEQTIFIHFTDPGGRILWQNDHRPTTPTNRWAPGSTYVDGPFDVDIPDSISAGTYDVRVGMFIPTVGRLPLMGRDAGQHSYIVGRITLKRGADPAVALQPIEEAVSGLLPGRNPTGSVLDFGSIRTNMTLHLVKTDDSIRIMPIPHGAEGDISFDLHAYAKLLTPQNVVVTAHGKDGNRLGIVPLSIDGPFIHFQAASSDAWTYKLTPASR